MSATALFRIVGLLALCVGTAWADRVPGSCGPITVGRSGTQNNCTVATLRLALDKARDDDCHQDIIWLTRDVDANAFGDGTIEIRDQNVEIIGGFDDCDDIQPSGYQVLSGAGGASESVIRIRGHSRVWLSHLEIVDGDEGINDYGGGIDFQGTGSLRLRHLHLLRNTAGYGGGLHVSGGSLGNYVSVTLGDDVVIADNLAARNGGASMSVAMSP